MGISLLKHLAILWGLLLLLSCNQNSPHSGQKLASQYCQGCHLPPSPRDLDRYTWQNEVLPRMVARLGYNSGRQAEMDSLQKMHLLPDTALITAEEWNQLQNYFLSTSPPFPERSQYLLNISPNLEGFQRGGGKPLKSEPPFLTLVCFDTHSQQLFLGNAITKSLSTYDIQKGAKKSINLTGSPSHLLVDEDGLYVLTMGKVMPHNQKSGTLTFIPKNQQGEWLKPEIWIKDLQRPVHASFGDLDNDGKQDMVIASFGNYVGELAWYRDFRSPQRKKHVLSSRPGAIKSVLSDFNGDGMTDILALMSQGDEGFFLFLNQGNGSFQEQVLMRFPPTYGSTYFDWIDMDGDGREDILYVNGDNGDYPPIVKRFHGIRLFRNQGDLKFEEVFFLEQHGAFKAKAADFDQDGDMDIAAISYFPDYAERPEESFVYYENKGGFDFQASTFEELSSGKWLTMDTGDIDGDGDRDIFLGSALFMIQDAPRKLASDWRRKGVPLLILENVFDSLSLPSGSASLLL
jgi:hypothetical protein